MSSEALAEKLYNAVFYQDYSQVDTLLKKGAPTHFKHPIFGDTPLHCAIRYHKDNSTAILQLLIKHGADYSAVDKNKLTPVELAAQSQTDHLVTLVNGKRDLIGDYKFDSALVRAARNNYTEHVRALLKSHASPNQFAALPDGYFPVHYAVEYKNIAMLELLIENGVDLCVRDKKGRTALDLAFELNGTNRIKVLKNAGAPFTHQSAEFVNGLTPNSYFDTETGNYPLHHAALHGHEGMINTLISLGATLDVKNHAGQTPLDIAFQHKKTSAIEILYRKKAPYTLHALPDIDWGSKDYTVEIAERMLDEFVGVKQDTENKLSCTHEHVEAMVNKVLLFFHGSWGGYYGQQIYFKIGHFFFNQITTNLNPQSPEENSSQANEDEERYINTLFFLILSGDHTNITELTKTQCYLGLMGLAKKNLSFYNKFSATKLLITDCLNASNKKNKTTQAAIEKLIEKLKPYEADPHDSAQKVYYVKEEMGKLYFFLEDYENAFKCWEELYLKVTPTSCNEAYSNLVTLLEKVKSLIPTQPEYQPLTDRIYIHLLTEKTKQTHEETAANARTELSKFYFENNNFEEAVKIGFINIDSAYPKIHGITALTEHQKFLFLSSETRKYIPHSITEMIFLLYKDSGLINKNLLSGLIQENIPSIITIIFEEIFLYSQLSVTVALDYFLNKDIQNKPSQQIKNNFLLYCLQSKPEELTEPHHLLYCASHIPKDFFDISLLQKNNIIEKLTRFSAEQKTEFFYLALSIEKKIIGSKTLEYFEPYKSDIASAYYQIDDYTTCSQLAFGDDELNLLTNEQKEYFSHPLVRKSLPPETLVSVIKNNKEDAHFLNRTLLLAIIEETTLHKRRFIVLTIFKNPCLYKRLDATFALNYFIEKNLQDHLSTKNIFDFILFTLKNCADNILKNDILEKLDIKTRLSLQADKNIEKEFFNATALALSKSRFTRNEIENLLEFWGENFVEKIFNPCALQLTFSTNADKKNFCAKIMLSAILSNKDENPSSKKFIQQFKDFPCEPGLLDALFSHVMASTTLTDLQKQHWGKTLSKFALNALFLNQEKLTRYEIGQKLIDTQKTLLFSQKNYASFTLLGAKLNSAQILHNKIESLNLSQNFIEKYYKICASDEKTKARVLKKIQNHYSPTFFGSSESAHLLSSLKSGKNSEEKLKILHDYMTEENKNTGLLKNKDNTLYKIIDSEMSALTFT